MPIESASDLKAAASYLASHSNEFDKEKQNKLKRGLTRHAKRLGVTINLATSGTGLGERGKTTAQPRQFGGRFGVKGSQPTFTPSQISEAIAQLKPGQSINLPNNKGKVKRLGNGFQVVTPNGDTNVVLKTPALAASKANSLVGSSPKGVKQ